MSLRKLKGIFGALDLNTVKGIIRNTKRGISILRDVDSLADKHNIEIVKNLTDRLLASKNLKKLEGGLEIGNRLISAVGQSRKSGLFNPPPKGFKDHNVLNEEGKNYALRRRQSVLEKDTIQTLPVKDTKIFTPLDEMREAENIVRNIK